MDLHLTNCQRCDYSSKPPTRCSVSKNSTTTTTKSKNIVVAELYGMSLSDHSSLLLAIICAFRRFIICSRVVAIVVVVACLLLVAATLSKHSIKKWNFVALLYADTGHSNGGGTAMETNTLKSTLQSVEALSFTAPHAKPRLLAEPSVSIAMLHWGGALLFAHESNHHPHSLLVKLSFFSLLLMLLSLLLVFLLLALFAM